MRKIIFFDRLEKKNRKIINVNVKQLIHVLNTNTLKTYLTENYFVKPHFFSLFQILFLKNDDLDIFLL
jgi:hypothetical protein